MMARDYYSQLSVYYSPNYRIIVKIGFHIYLDGPLNLNSTDFVFYNFINHAMVSSISSYEELTVLPLVATRTNQEAKVGIDCKTL